MLCKAVCPTKAITIREDEEGFQYPEIDEQKCIHCGKCKKVCCFNNHNDTNQEKIEPQVFAVKNKNDEIRKKATSGGFFISLASNVIKKGGVVYGAILNEGLDVEHIRVTEEKDLEKFYGSKYVQSTIDKIYPQLLEDITNNKMVLFSGTPCQVDAIQTFLAQKNQFDISNLITCDFVCHGVPTDKIFKENIKFLEKKYQKKITSYRFRTKDYGWRGHHEKAIFEDGTDTTQYNNRYMNIYKELYGSLKIIRPSCYHCPYAKEQRISDITMGDFWGIENYDQNFSDNKGISFVMLNTKKGQQIFEDIKKEDLDDKKETIEMCVNPQLKHPTTQAKNRELFWKEYQEKGYEYIAKKYTTYGIIKKIRVTIYQILKKIR